MTRLDTMLQWLGCRSVQSLTQVQPASKLIVPHDLRHACVAAQLAGLERRRGILWTILCMVMAGYNQDVVAVSVCAPAPEKVLLQRRCCLNPLVSNTVNVIWLFRYTTMLHSVDAPEGHRAELGNAVVVDMTPYEVLADGSRGDELPKFAGGTDVEIVMDKEKFMPGLMEGLLGITVGDTREITVRAAYTHHASQVTQP